MNTPYYVQLYAVEVLADETVSNGVSEPNADVTSDDIGLLLQALDDKAKTYVGAVEKKTATGTDKKLARKTLRQILELKEKLSGLAD